MAAKKPLLLVYKNISFHNPDIFQSHGPIVATTQRRNDATMKFSENRYGIEREINVIR